MVDATIDDSSQTGQIVLQPNFSWSWRANLYLLYTLAIVSAVIGLGFMVMGAWMVLPFSIIELTALYLCIHYCVRQCNRQEVITVSEHGVQVESGISQVDEIRHYQRMWAKFHVKPAKHPWDAQVVSISSHGEEQELGSFLNRKDKSQLIAELRRVVPR